MVLPNPSYRKGDRPKATELNSIIREIKSNQAQISRLSARLKKGGVTNDPGIPVRVFNNTGDPLVIYEVAGIKDQAYTGATQRQTDRCFEIEAFEPGKHYFQFVVCKEKIAYQTVGWAWLIGGFYCKINVTNENHQFAAPKEGETYLQSALEGPCVINWQDSGTGEVDARVTMSRTVPRWYRAARDQSADTRTDVFRTDTNGDQVGEVIECIVLPESGYIIKNDWVRLFEVSGEIFCFKDWQHEVLAAEEGVMESGWDRRNPSTHHDGIEIPVLYDPDDTSKVAYVIADYSGQIQRIYGSDGPSPTPGPTNTPPPTPSPTPTVVGPTPTGPAPACNHCDPDPVWIKLTLTNWVVTFAGITWTCNGAYLLDTLMVNDGTRCRYQASNGDGVDGQHFIVPGTGPITSPQIVPSVDVLNTGEVNIVIFQADGGFGITNGGVKSDAVPGCVDITLTDANGSKLVKGGDPDGAAWIGKVDFRF